MMALYYKSAQSTSFCLNNHSFHKRSLHHHMPIISTVIEVSLLKTMHPANTTKSKPS